MWKFLNKPTYSFLELMVIVFISELVTKSLGF